MDRSPSEIQGGLLMFCEISFDLLDPLLEEEIPVIFPEQKKDVSFLEQRERSRDRDILKH